MARFAGSSEFMDAYNAVADSGLNIGALTGAGQLSQAKQRANAMEQTANLKKAADQAEAIEAGADARADMYSAQGQAAFNESIAGGIQSAVGSIAGGIGGGGGGGGASIGSSVSPQLAGTYSSGLNVAGMTPSQILTNPNIPTGFFPLGR